MENSEKKIAEPIVEKSKKLPIIIGCFAFIVLVAAVLLTFLYFIPSHHYNKGIEMFDAGDYSSSYDHFISAGSFKDSESRAQLALKGTYYLNGVAALEEFRFVDARNYLYSAGDFPGASEKYAIIDSEEIYHTADVAYLNNDFETAIELFQSLEEYKDSFVRYQESIYALANQYFDSGDYYEAADYFVDIEEYEDSLERATECANLLFEAEDYRRAATIFSNVGEIDFANYSRGFMYLSEENYGEAVSYFNNAGDFEDAHELALKCGFYRAENYFQDGDLHNALTYFGYLPEDLVVDGISVADRLSLLESHMDYVELTGTWGSTENEFRCCETFTYYGTTYWYNEDATALATLKVRCHINDDGSVEVSGTATYFMYTSYSSVSYYCGYNFDEISTFRFTVPAGGSIPRNIDGTNNASFSYSNGYFRLQRTDYTRYTATYYDSFIADITFNDYRNYYL